MPEDFSELDGLPAFDRDRFDILSELSDDGDSGILKEITRQFLDDVEPIARKIDEGCAVGESMQVAHEAHALKGGAGQFGLLKVEEVARRLELAARAGKWDEIERWRVEIKKALPEGIEPLERFVKEV